jgi:dTMP kinase
MSERDSSGETAQARDGCFVTFEGVDGSGKTTQMRRLAARLRAAGREVIETVEPGGTAVGMAIRRILLDPANSNLGSIAEMLLYFAARAQNVHEILLPALERGAVVLSDRWTDSTYAYQGHGRGLGTGVVAELDSIACQAQRPHLTIWIDVELETSLQRARHRNAECAASDTRMDEQSRVFYERVVEGYRMLAGSEPERFQRVDGNGTLEEVERRVNELWERWEASK